MPRINHLPADTNLKSDDLVLIHDTAGTKTAKVSQITDLISATTDTVSGAVPFVLNKKDVTSPMRLENLESYEFTPKNLTLEENVYATGFNTIKMGSDAGAILRAKDSFVEGGYIVITNQNGDKHFGEITDISDDDIVTIDPEFEDYEDFGIDNLGSTLLSYSGRIYLGKDIIRLLTFGSSEGQVAEWAEGNSGDNVPVGKLPVKGFTGDNTAGYVIDWAESNNTDAIPLNKIPVLDSSKIPNIQFGDQVTFDNNTDRNAVPSNPWHPGDRAIVGGNVYLYVGEDQGDTAAATDDSDWSLLNITLQFGSGSNQIATWAEGSNTDLIPAAKFQSYNVIQDSQGNDADQESNLRFNDNFAVDDSNDSYTLISHSNTIDIGEPTGIIPGEVNVQGFASTNLPHINLIGAGVSSQDVGQVVFQHYHQIEDKVNTLFKIVGGSENHQIDPDDSDGYDEDGFLKFVSVESKDGSADVQVEVASFHKDKILLNQELTLSDVNDGTIDSAGYLGLDSDNKLVKSGNPLSFGANSGEVAVWAQGNNTTIPIPSGLIPNIQFGDQHSYADSDARNAASDVAWHKGDRAIVEDDGIVYIYDGANQDSPASTTDADWIALNTVSVEYTLPDDLSAWRNKINDSGDIPNGTTIAPANDNNAFLGAGSKRFQTIYGKTIDSDRYVIQNGGRIYGGSINNSNTNIRFESDADLSFNFSGNARFRMGNDSLNISTNVIGDSAADDEILSIDSSGNVRSAPAVDKINNSKSGSTQTLNVWYGTQSEYDALTKDDDTIYFVS